MKAATDVEEEMKAAAGAEVATKVAAADAKAEMKAAADAKTAAEVAAVDAKAGMKAAADAAGNRGGGSRCRGRDEGSNICKVLQIQRWRQQQMQSKR